MNYIKTNTENCKHNSDGLNAISILCDPKRHTHQSPEMQKIFNLHNFSTLCEEIDVFSIEPDLDIMLFFNKIWFDIANGDRKFIIKNLKAIRFSTLKKTQTK